MISIMKNVVGKIVFIVSRKILMLLGFQISLGNQIRQYPELTISENDFCNEVFGKSLTLTSVESLKLLAISCKYVKFNKIEGDFVETGIWRGGSSIVAKYIFQDSKKMYLYDTFDGMTEPSDFDYRIGETSSKATVEKWESLITDTGNKWVAASLEEVRKNFSRFNLLDDSIHFVKGDIRFTLKSVENLPTRVSILRIDTDFYDSTLLSLEIFWPLLTKGGVLILDDYAHWDGARRAVDEYFQQNGLGNLIKVPIAGGGGRLVLKP